MNFSGITKSIALAVAALAIFGLVTTSQAQVTLGPGPGVLDEEGANNAVDTSTDGSNDQSRQNLDISFTELLDAGTYSASTWSFNAGQVGSVTPYVAFSTGDKTYEILAVGAQVDIGAEDLDTVMTVPFGGAPFTLDATTELFGGIVNPMEVGSQNPIYTNLASGGQMDHDNNADGMMSPAVVGGTVDGFGHANLGRSYAFSINVVPEPSAGLLTAIGGLAILMIRRRRR